MCPHRLAVRTPPFHGGNRGSSPRGDAILRAYLQSQTEEVCGLPLKSIPYINFG